MAVRGRVATLGQYASACQIDTWSATPGMCLEYQSVRAKDDTVWTRRARRRRVA